MNIMVNFSCATIAVPAIMVELKVPLSKNNMPIFSIASRKAANKKAKAMGFPAFIKKLRR